MSSFVCSHSFAHKKKHCVFIYKQINNFKGYMRFIHCMQIEKKPSNGRQCNQPQPYIQHLCQTLKQQ